MTSLAISVVVGADPSHVTNMLASLRSLAGDDRIATTIVVTLNAPGARDSVDAALAALGPQVRTMVRENERPRGFAANHNAAVASVDADLYLIANDDVIVSDDAVQQLVGFMGDTSDERVAVVSPVLRNPDGSLQPSTSSFPTVPRALLSISGLRKARIVDVLVRAVGRLPVFGGGRTKYWAHDETMRVDTLNGAFVLVRGAAIADVGPMDEVSLAGGEEAEWHARMAQRGWAVVLFPGAEVVHVAEATVGSWPDRDVEYTRGWLNYFAKHATPGRRRAAAAGSVAIWTLRAVGASLRGDGAARRRAFEGARIGAALWRDGLVRVSDRVEERA